MKVTEILFTDESQTTIVIRYENGDNVQMTYPPNSEEDRKIVEEYGGYYAIYETSKQLSANWEILESKYNAIMKMEHVITNYQLINFLLNQEYDRDDLLKQKMQLFTDSDVVACKDKTALTRLRKASSIMEILTAYGMIKLGIKECECEQ